MLRYLLSRYSLNKLVWAANEANGFKTRYMPVVVLEVKLELRKKL